MILTHCSQDPVLMLFARHSIELRTPDSCGPSEGGRACKTSEQEESQNQWRTERTGYGVGKTEREPNKRLATTHMQLLLTPVMPCILL